MFQKIRDLDYKESSKDGSSKVNPYIFSDLENPDDEDTYNNQDNYDY